MPFCNPFAAEIELDAYAHIDATGTIKRNSYEEWGVTIGDDGILKALEELNQKER
jgi:hypothetical protein